MASINNLGGITLTRGDCFKAPLFINIGTESEPIRLNVNIFPELEVYLGVYLPGSRFENSLIRKRFTDKDCNEHGDVVISIEPQDTLKLRSGTYMYTIKARIYSKEYGEWVATVVDSSKFQLR